MMMHPNSVYPTGPNVVAIQPPGGGGEHAGKANKELLYVKIRKGRDFPEEESGVVVKKGQLTGKSELNNKDKTEVVIVFPIPGPAPARAPVQTPAVSAPEEKIAISITNKDKPPAVVGKLELLENAGWYEYSATDAAVSPHSFNVPPGGDNNKERLMVSIWMGHKTHPAYANAVMATPPAAANIPTNPSLLKKDHAHPMLAYYQLLVTPYVTKDPEKMNQNYMQFYLVATIGNQTVYTFTINTLPIFPNDQHPDLIDLNKTSYKHETDTKFWFVKLSGTPPDSVKLVLKLMAYRHKPLNDGEPNEPKAVGIAEKRLNTLSPDKVELVKLMTPGGEEDSKKDTGVSVRVWKSADLTGYHVFDEPLDQSSNFHPTTTDSFNWEPSSRRKIGALVVKIVGAKEVVSAKKGAKGANVYCVARYDRKWHRTATVSTNLAMRFDEVFEWDVYEINTVFTVALFEDCQLATAAAAKDGDDEDEKKEAAEDKNIGRVKIHVFSLSTNRTYNYEFVFNVKQPDGSLKKMGKLELEYKFTGELYNLIWHYFRPLLPLKHYTNPIPEGEVDRLCPFAVGLVAEKLAKENPPLMKKAVEYMYGLSDVERRLRENEVANMEYIWKLGNKILSTLENAFSWRNPTETAWVIFFLIAGIAFPELVPTMIFVICASIPMRAYFNRPKPLPGAQSIIIVAEAEPNQTAYNKRYEVLRKKAWECETFLDNLATKVESVKALLGWRNPLATAVVVVFCFVATVPLFYVSFQTVAIICVLCVFSYPFLVPTSWRGGVPLLNFLRRVPGLNDNDVTVI